MPFHATSLQHYYAFTILCCCHHYHHQRKQHHLQQKKCQSPVANNRNLHRQTKQSFCCLRHLRHQMPLLPPPDKDTLRDVMPFHATSLQSTSSQEMTYHCMLRHGTAHHNHATAWYAKLLSHQDLPNTIRVYLQWSCYLPLMNKVATAANNAATASKQDKQSYYRSKNLR